MSVAGVEKALYDVTTDRASRTLFRDDPEAFLGRYRLDDAQRAALCTFDVRGLAALPANPMLVWGFWMTCAPDRSGAAYLRRMRGEGADHG
ncbi:MAG TPA: hypothetical protein VGE11_07475 [Pseudonocardia sp.]